MTKQRNTVVGVLVLMILVTVATAKGQSASQRFVANIPFAFNAGNETLPAGEYEVTIVNPSSDQRVIKIRRATGMHSVMLQTHSVYSHSPNAAKLIFRRYDDRYFLAQAWTGVDQNGLEASKSRAEKKLRSEYAAIRQRLESVSLTRGQ